MGKKEKLVRDQIPLFSAVQEDGRRFRVAAPEELPRLLGEKLIEEAHEVAHELMHLTNDSALLMDEIADVAEVLTAIVEQYKLSRVDIRNLKRNKAEVKGTFSHRIVLDLNTNLEVERKKYG